MDRRPPPDAEHAAGGGTAPDEGARSPEGASEHAPDRPAERVGGDCGADGPGGQGDGQRQASPPPVRHVNIIQAAALLGVSRRTIYYWLKSGRLQPVKTPYGTLITVESLELEPRWRRRKAR